jgi:hypothetical protein
MLVLQSTRDPRDPPWIADCLASVREWAERVGAAYRLIDDALFDPVPSDTRTKLADRPTSLSDLARLVWIERLLAKHDAVAWVDADVFVFAPDRLTLPDVPHAFGREIWVARDASGRWRTWRQIHNAVMAFRVDSTFLAFYRQTGEDLLRRHAGPPVPQLIGPKLLSALHRVVGFPVIEAAGMASPSVLDELAARRPGPALRRLTSSHGAPLGALNLGQSLAPDADHMAAAIASLRDGGLDKP